MRTGKILAGGALLCLAVGLGRFAAVAGDSAPTTWNQSNTDGTLEWPWTGPHWWGQGPEDFVNARYDGLAGRPINGVSIAAHDYSEGASFALVGLFEANLGLDPTGNTPDLNHGITTVDPVFGGDLDYVYATFGGTYTPSSDPQHVVVQMNPDDFGLYVGCDEDEPRGGFSGWTSDGYMTPASDAWADLGMSVNIDVCQEFAGTAGRLGLCRKLTDESGDFVTATTLIDEDLGAVFFAPASGSLWMLFLSVAGAPVVPVSTSLPTIPDGSCGYLRAGTVWPYGFGDMTFNLVAVSGVPGVRGSVGISNEVTLIVLTDPVCTWGVKDDGTYETQYAVWTPAGSADYFSTWFNCRTPPVVDRVTDMKVAVFDFGTTATAFPTSGVFAANLSLDPTGWTPDLTAGYAVAPFTFPPGVLASTSGQLVVRDFPDIPYSTFPDDNVHGVIQFPPGEQGQLGIGADTTPTLVIEWGSTWTTDGYTTPAFRYDEYAGWGLRLGSQ
ncbi:MAG: hypothetical protein AB1486_25895 [Planctomycetota bacterium]